MTRANLGVLIGEDSDEDNEADEPSVWFTNFRNTEFYLFIIIIS